jgi:hypothetical protein
MILRLDHGLVEVRFRSGASVVLEGPSAFELLSVNSARLLKGRLAARVPEPARGFEIFTPEGRVVDLGTEFGISVSDKGSADVYVFKGKVQAYSGSSNATDLSENRTARIAPNAVEIDPLDNRPSAAEFTRRISPAPDLEPRTLRLDFREPVAGSIKDATGLGTGLDWRLQGTGELLPKSDPNLRIDPSGNGLAITTTRSDINQQFGLGKGEYLGTRLSSLGFTGQEDFEVTAVLPNIPSLAEVGQFGLYAGAGGSKNIRGGLISRGIADDYKQFLVNNNGGLDSDAMFIGVIPTGANVQFTLRRERGKYAMSIESLTTGASSTLSIAHPAFLDNEKDLYVGLFAANTGSNITRTLVLKELKVTVWTRIADRSGADKYEP